MRAADTNVVVRLLVADDPEQVAAAERFLNAAGTVWVSHVVLVETIWVLGSVYARTRAQMIAAVESLLDHQRLVLQEANLVAAALELYRVRGRVGFSDCLVLCIARSAGHLPLATFDGALGKLDGTKQL